MVVKNKWNGGLYEIQKEGNNSIELRRCSDGKVFEINKSEFAFSYKKTTQEKKK